jgi:copper chaperone CopZ
MNLIKLKIQNLKCGGCEKTIMDNLFKIKGVYHLKINNLLNEVEFEYELDESLAKVKQKLNQLGYPIMGEQNKLLHKAKSYVSCAIGRVKA